jgi:hypothetical protein
MKREWLRELCYFSFIEIAIKLVPRDAEKVLFYFFY